MFFSVISPSQKNISILLTVLQRTQIVYTKCSLRNETFQWCCWLTETYQNTISISTYHITHIYKSIYLLLLLLLLYNKYINSKIKRAIPLFAATHASNRNLSLRVCLQRAQWKGTIAYIENQQIRIGYNFI